VHVWLHGTTLTLPYEPTLAEFREHPLRLELACAIYASRGISRGLAAKLVGMDLDAFEAKLHDRSISNGIKPFDLDADLAVLAQLLKA
jgi:predicted HTH domain antitoxin